MTATVRPIQEISQADIGESWCGMGSGKQLGSRNIHVLSYGGQRGQLCVEVNHLIVGTNGKGYIDCGVPGTSRQNARCGSRQHGTCRSIVRGTNS